MPTPFLDNLDLDLGGARKLFETLEAEGIDSVFIAGTTGEFTALSDDERIATIDAALRVFGPDRVFAHIGAASARQAVNLTHRAVQVGATRLAAITPYYFPSPTAATVEYFERILEASDGAEVFGYLFRGRTNTLLEPQAIPQLARIGLSGVKISGESEAMVAEYLANAPDGFTVLSGDDLSFPSFVGKGGDGVVSGVSSVFPKPFISMRNALQFDDEIGVKAALDGISCAVRVLEAGSLAHLKAGLKLKGLPAGPVRCAVNALPSQDLPSIERELVKWLGDDHVSEH